MSQDLWRLFQIVYIDCCCLRDDDGDDDDDDDDDNNSWEQG